MNFIVGAQPYKHNSAGVRVLYELAARLMVRGHGAQVIHPWGIPKSLAERSIVVYPESIAGNPCGGDKIVRYILNVPGVMGGDKEYAKDELLVAYRADFASYSGGEVLCLPVIEPFFCVDLLVPKLFSVVYVGKGENTSAHPDDCVPITPEWPRTREQVAFILQCADVLYTYDGVSAIIDEAERCGCKVIKMPEVKEIKAPLVPSVKEIDVQMDRFLERCREKWNN